MILAVGRFFMKLSSIGEDIFYAWDEYDLMTLLGYGPWLIFGIWAVFDSRGSIPLVLAIFLALMVISICGEITMFLVMGLKILLMALFVPIDWLAAWARRYENRTTGIWKYISIDEKACGDSLWHAAYLHD